MRPASAGHATGQLRSRLQVKVGNQGLCRRTEPRDADTQMQGFLDRGTVPVLLFKASPQQVQASLARPLQAVRTELMGIAMAILDRVAGGYSSRIVPSRERAIAQNNTNNGSRSQEAMFDVWEATALRFFSNQHHKN